jgi:hypothetical protein
MRIYSITYNNIYSLTLNGKGIAITTKIMRRLMISLLFSFILLALGAVASLAISVAGDIVHNFVSY